MWNWGGEELGQLKLRRELSSMLVTLAWSSGLWSLASSLDESHGELTAITLDPPPRFPANDRVRGGTNFGVRVMNAQQPLQRLHKHGFPRRELFSN